MNKYSFGSFSQKTIYLARKRGIKITNKNIEKLRQAFISRRCREEPKNVMSVILRCTYEDVIQEVLLKPSPILTELMTVSKGSSWCQPVVFKL